VNPFFTARSVGPIYPVFAQNMQTEDSFLTNLEIQIYDTGDLVNLVFLLEELAPSQAVHVVQETILNVDSFDRDVISARAYAEVSF